MVYCIFSYTPLLKRPNTVQSAVCNNPSSILRTLASPQPYSLAILLQLGDELISLLHNIRILLVLVVGSVGLDDALSRHTVNGTCNAISCNELGQITKDVSKYQVIKI